MAWLAEMPWRAVAVGFLISALVTLYAAYAGLKFAGVYWPILTTSLAAMAIMKLLGNTTKNEINVAQTAGSAGGLVAAGVIFTIPALYMMGMQISAASISLIALGGGLLGVLFSYPLRSEMLEKDSLPYPDGTAAAALIASGDEGGQKTKMLAAGGLAGGAVALLRELFHAIPGGVNLETFKISSARLFSLGTALSLIPLAGGYLIGFIFTAAWFSGAVLAYFIIAPYLVASGQVLDKEIALATMAKPLGIGIVVGGAIGYFVLIGIPRIRGALEPWLKGARFERKKPIGRGEITYGSALVLLAALLVFVLNLDAGITAVALAGAFAMAYLGARITGEMNIDPMEIFAVIAILAAKVLFGSAAGALVLLAAVVSISAGVAGDIMQDLKAGKLLGTDPRHQLVAQIAGVAAGALVIGFVVSAIAAKSGFGGAEFPAPQAVALRELVGGGSSEAVCLRSVHFDALGNVLAALGLKDCVAVGAMLGVLLTIASHYLGSAALPIAFGIGMYVPIELTMPLFIGGIARVIADAKGKTGILRVLAAGAIAGEGIIGALLAVGGAAVLLFLH